MSRHDPRFVGGPVRRGNLACLLRLHAWKMLPGMRTRDAMWPEPYKACLTCGLWTVDTPILWSIGPSSSTSWGAWGSPQYEGGPSDNPVDIEVFRDLLAFFDSDR